MYIPADPKLWDDIFKEKLFRKPIFWVPIIIGLILTYSISEIALLESLILKKTILLINEYLRFFETWKGNSPYPYSSLVIFLFNLFLTPYYTTIFYIHSKNELRVQNFNYPLKDYKILLLLRSTLILITLLIFFLSLFYILIIFPDNQNYKAFHLDTRFEQYFFSFIFTLGTSSVLSTILNCTLNFKKILKAMQANERER